MNSSSVWCQKHKVAQCHLVYRGVSDFHQRHLQEVNLQSLGYERRSAGDKCVPLSSGCVKVLVFWCVLALLVGVFVIL